MNKIYNSLLLCALLAGIFVPLHAADGAGYPLYSGAVSIEPVSLREENEKLHIELDITVRCQAMNDCQSWTIIPEIATNHRSQVLELPDILVNGKRKARLLDRKIRFGNRAALASPPSVRFDASAGRDTTFRYRTTVDYELWMDTATLHIRQILTSCADKEQLFITRAAAMIEPESYEPYLPAPVVTFLTPEKSEKIRNVEGKAYLDFEVGRSIILPSYRRNPGELARIDGMFSEIRNDRDFTIQQIVIEGYASPDGPYDTNDRLSRERAEALKNYIRNSYSIPDHLFVVRNTPEDWDTLVEMLSRSDMPEKDRILDVIRTVGIFDGRESRLMRMDGGRPYRFMLNEMFPELRRVEYRVEYSIRDYSIEESEKLAEMTPENLDAYELYLLAQTYEIGSPRWNDIMEKSIVLYPEDPAMIHNFAAMLLLRNDFTTAKHYLDRLGENEATGNNYGVFYLRTGEYDKAEDALRRAAGKGSAEAAHNLEEVRRIREDLERAQRHELRTARTER